MIVLYFLFYKVSYENKEIVDLEVEENERTKWFGKKEIGGYRFF